MNLMMLTAGLGTRLRPLTNHLPKPAIPLLNVPLFRYALTPIERLGLDSVVFNTHHLPDVMKTTIESEPISAKQLIITNEHPHILGSAGGIKLAENSLRGNGAFWVVNGDTVFLPHDTGTFASMQSQHEQQSPLATLLCAPHPAAGKGLSAIWVDLEGRVHGIGLTPPDSYPGSLTPMHFTGFQILSDSIFKLIPENESCHIFTDIIVPAIQAGDKVDAFCAEGHWFETGNYQDYLKTTRELLRLYSCPAIVPPLLAEVLADHHPIHRDHALVYCGTSCHLEATLKPDTIVFCGNDCSISSQVKISGFVVVADNIHLQGPCVLENVVLLPGANVSAGSHLRDTVIGPSLL